MGELYFYKEITLKNNKKSNIFDYMQSQTNSGLLYPNSTKSAPPEFQDKLKVAVFDTNINNWSGDFVYDYNNSYSIITGEKLDYYSSETEEVASNPPSVNIKYPVWNSDLQAWEENQDKINEDLYTTKNKELKDYYNSIKNIDFTYELKGVKVKCKIDPNLKTLFDTFLISLPVNDARYYYTDEEGNKNKFVQFENQEEIEKMKTACIIKNNDIEHQFRNAKQKIFELYNAKNWGDMQKFNPVEEIIFTIQIEDL